MISGAVAQDIRYRVLRLPTLPDVQPVTVAHDINDDGVVCGGSRTHGHSHAIIWDISNGIRILENMVSGIDLGSFANALNASSDVAGDGGYYHDSDYTNQAFLWRSSSGTMGIGDLPGSIFSSRANGINNLGHIVGYSVSAHYGEPMQEAFLWTPEGGMIGLGTLIGSGHWSSYAADINDSGWITGDSDSSRGIEAFIWTAETGMVGLGDITGSPFSFSLGYAINASGQIAGISASTTTTAGVEAMFWSPEEGMIGLGVLPGHEASSAEDLNNREQVVGWSRLPYPPGYTEAFIWDRQRGMRSLNALLDPCVPASQRHMGEALAINNHGQIVATDGAGGIFLDPYIPGDLDGDGAVTLQDLATLLAHFGRSGDVGYIQGDIHGCDRDVDLEDLATLLENFGQTLE
ncbi:MAG: hypothetical protein IT450_21045 [Phycisphaerales bacterium]|nr:hypothetical protein [Phycisphaerales bacterium]